MAVLELASAIDLPLGGARVEVTVVFLGLSASAMSHSSNIPVSKQLDSVWGDARTNGDVRFIKIVIQGDQLVDTHVQKLTSSFDNDYKAIEQHLQPKLPCYVLFRLDRCVSMMLLFFFKALTRLQQEHDRFRVAASHVHP
jgi:hypothetical protein